MANLTAQQVASGSLDATSFIDVSIALADSVRAFHAAEYFHIGSQRDLALFVGILRDALRIDSRSDFFAALARFASVHPDLHDELLSDVFERLSIKTIDELLPATHVAPTASHEAAPARLDPASFGDVSLAFSRSLRYFSEHVTFASISDAHALDVHVNRVRSALHSEVRSAFFEALANFSAAAPEVYDEFMADVLGSLGIKKINDLLPLFAAPKLPTRTVALTSVQFRLLSRAAAALRSTRFDAAERSELESLAQHFELTADQLA